MQNKSAVILFTILLALAALYVLSFNWVANRYEKVALSYGQSVADSLIDAGAYTDSQFDSLATANQRKFLRDSANAEIYPVFGQTYQEVKEQELNLGLDLKGGMSVTLEVSIADLVVALSDYSDQPNFVAAIQRAKDLQKEANDDYITLFERAWNEQKADLELWRIFNNPENKDLFPAKSTNDEVFDILRNEAEQAINNTENIIRKRIDQFGVAQPNVQKMSFSGRILVELPGVDDRDRVRKQLKATANLEFWETLYTDEVINQLGAANDAIAKALNPKIYAKADSLAKDTTLEPLTAEEQALRSPLFAILQPNFTSRNPVVGFAREGDVEDINALLERPEAKQALNSNLRLLWSAKPQDGVVQLYAIRDDSGKGKAKLTGKTIVDARVGYDQIGDVIVNMTMDSEGTAIWGKMTEEAAADNKRPVAVVMDKMVYSAPNVQTAITSGRSQISFGTATTTEEKLQEAEDLAGLLKAGSLPAPAKIVDEVSVGPQLGEENINAGMWSFAIALLVILIYMIFYYKGAGLVSDIALIANLFFLIGALASLKAALTLPGIAGIVLTIGMAVDANVLIYERIKEEMRGGKGLALAIKDGYSRAYSAIIDANITTLLTAVVLYAFGSGAIRGFATTLIIGIFTSLFSAIVLTRLIFFSRLEGKKAISFYSNLTKDWFTNTTIKFIEKRKIFYVVSALVIAGGIASLATRGLNYGVDFSGGTTFDITFNEDIDINKIRTNLSDAFTENGTKGNPIVQTKETARDIRVMTNFMIDSDADNVDEQINNSLEEGLSPLVQGTDYRIGRYNKVDSTISDDFRRGATYATIFSLIVIFLYIFFRFRKWQFGAGALIAMIHDVLVVLSLFSIFWGVLPFTMEIDQAFIAAILTVIGYSINDTVVVFDRIREYIGLHSKTKTDSEIINSALNSTLGRTINTSLSTFVVLFTIFLFGGDNIKGFVFALMAGVVVGTYSSIFIASPAVLDFTKQLGDVKREIGDTKRD